MFYVYQQNNSGGSFQIDKYVQRFVLIEADNPSEADDIAKEKAGIYFEGVFWGDDCGCCGDRWHNSSKWNARTEDQLKQCFQHLHYPSEYINCVVYPKDSDKFYGNYDHYSHNPYGIYDN